ncbi:MAG: DUF2617 family protein [Phycisphaerae bacterium]
MELGITKQQSIDMHFFLYRRALHPELFHIYTDKHLVYGDFQADIWITGLSHLVTVQNNGVIVTELAAVPSGLLTDRSLVTQFRFRGERDFQFRFNDDVRYIFSSQIEEMTEHIFRTTYRDLARYATKRGLFVPYPQWTTHGLEPFSYIDYETRHDELHIHAYHAFPGEWRILRTQSIFERPPELRDTH